MGVKTIIFDFDGTLGNTYELMGELVDKFAPKLTRTRILESDIREASSLTVAEIIKKYRISPFKILLYRSQILQYVKQQMPRIKPYPGIKKMLGEVSRQKMEMIILTLNNRDNVIEFLARQQIKSIDEVYSEKGMFSKGRAIINLLKRKKISDKETVIYIGDEVRDIVAARQAGTKIVAVSWGFNTRELLEKHQPDFLADTPGQVVEYIKMQNRR